ncbi:MAG: hypothetical protein IT210_11900 [Armatimonadetes bacterium]|nr:hypothetical protein [Armatimonadota bacterium]
MKGWLQKRWYTKQTPEAVRAALGDLAECCKILPLIDPAQDQRPAPHPREAKGYALGYRSKILLYGRYGHPTLESDIRNRLGLK